MKQEKQISKYFGKKDSYPKKSQSINRFKDKSIILMEQYQKPEIANDVNYMIDKVVRLRVQQGKFGIDYSEILNFEEEMANKPRTDHMNYLVYKT